MQELDLCCFIMCICLGGDIFHKVNILHSCCVTRRHRVTYAPETDVITMLITAEIPEDCFSVFSGQVGKNKLVSNGISYFSTVCRLSVCKKRLVEGLKK